MSTDKLPKDLIETILRGQNLAEEMSKKVQITPVPPEQKKFILRLLIEKIPLLSGFLQSLGSTGAATTGLISSLGKASEAVQGASAGFHYAGLGIAGVNFVRIPLIYFFSLIAGEPPPFTLSNNARWAYSALLLGLTLTAILVPAAAPPIALAMASLSLVLSLVSIGHMIYKRYTIQKSLRETEEKIKTKEDYLEDMRKNAQVFILKLKKLNTNDSDYEDRAKAICKEIEELNAKYQIAKDELQELSNQKLEDEQTLKGLGTAAFMDRGVTAALTSVAIIGLALSFFFPPVGLGIVAGSAGLGALYVVGRVAVALLAPIVSAQIKKLGLWNSKTNENGESPELSPSLDESLINENEESPELSSSLDKSLMKQPEDGIDSTAKTMQGLFGENAERELKQLIFEEEEMKKQEQRLLKIRNSDDHRGALYFLKDLSEKHANECPHGDLRCLSDLFPNLDTTIPLLKKAIEEVRNGELVLNEDEKKNLCASKPLMILLKQINLDLSFIDPSTQNTALSDETQKDDQLNLEQQ